MATALQWSSLGSPLCASTSSGTLVCKNCPFQCKFFHKGIFPNSMFGRCWTGQRSILGKIGAFDNTEPELLMNGSANTNAIGALALLLSDGQQDDDSVTSGQDSSSASIDLASANNDSNELYEKLAENALNVDPAAGALEDAADLEQEFHSEQIQGEGWAGPVEIQIAPSAYQQANRLLVAVNRTLDGLEDGLIKHAEELEASALSEEFAFTGSLEVDQLREEIICRDTLLDLLREEAIQATRSLKSATQAMVAARNKMTHLQERLDTTVGFLQQEKDATQNTLELFSSSLLALSDAEERIRELERQVDIGAQAPQQDKDYTAEITSLKGLLETKEKMMQAMQEETRRNANLLLAAAKTRDGLATAEKKVELLTAQVASLEEEVRTRDVLLQEVKHEMVRSTDALKLAAQIKQELNASKQRELELNQDLESQKGIVEELQQELAENHRAMRAEQALRQMEKNLKDLSLEVEMLREGVEARDDALRLMREEVDRSVDILSNASENRKALQQLTSYVEELRAELAVKDDKIESMQEELALAEKFLRQQRCVPEAIPNNREPTAAALPATSPPTETQVTKLKRKPSRRKQGNSSQKPSPQS